MRQERLTDHFTVGEMEFSATAARRGIDNRIPPELIPNALRVAQTLELVREHFGRPVRVLSCYRSPELNEAVGGSPRSAHMQAMAADIMIEGVPVRELARWCAEHLDADQVIEEFGEWVHVGLSASEPRGQFFVARKQNGRTVYAPAA